MNEDNELIISVDSQQLKRIMKERFMQHTKEIQKFIGIKQQQKNYLCG